MTMRRMRVAGIATGVLAALVAGCGGGALVATMDTATTSDSATSSVKLISARYCRLLEDGKWVTDDKADSTTPCVPDPSNATGDQQEDGSVPVPRCFTCKPSDWDRAESYAKHVLATPDAAPTTTATTDETPGWPMSVESSFVYGCASGGNDSEELCECVASQLAQQVPAAQAPSLSGTDPRVQAARGVCASRVK